MTSFEKTNWCRNWKSKLEREDEKEREREGEGEGGVRSNELERTIERIGDIKLEKEIHT